KTSSPREAKELVLAESARLLLTAVSRPPNSVQRDFQRITAALPHRFRPDNSPAMSAILVAFPVVGGLPHRYDRIPPDPLSSTRSSATVIPSVCSRSMVTGGWSGQETNTSPSRHGLRVQLRFVQTPIEARAWPDGVFRGHRMNYLTTRAGELMGGGGD